jgi:hypothetical protein
VKNLSFRDEYYESVKREQVDRSVFLLISQNWRYLIDEGNLPIGEEVKARDEQPDSELG